MSEKEVEIRDILDEYRRESDSVVNILVYKSHPEIEKIATVSEKFAFVNRIPRSKGEETIMGMMYEEMYMCEEFFDYAGGKREEGKEIWQMMIDTILNTEKSPFILVSFDDKTYNYILSKTELKRESLNVRVCKSKNTYFYLYKEKEISSEYDVTATEIELEV